ncbi:MAG TPA: SagB/ThcOx family dehydrogenase [Candidatus Saccharimonadales bacterium]|nr:SagB/ThcOx family dehydrogenase [Candidatus Saccharimonadales bacterium]
MAAHTLVTRNPYLRLAALAALLAWPAVAAAADLQPIQLPQPQITGGMPLMQALAARHSTREYAPTPLPPQTLSNLLWAAFGVNRAATGGRTAPSAINWQEFDVYVTLPEGAYLYDAKANTLKPVAEGDLRGATGVQPFVKEAALDLVFVADTTKMTRVRPEQRTFYIGADAAFIAQNVYLFCASEGLACVVRASVDKEAAAKALKLKPTQVVSLAQTVGYPKAAAKEAGEKP